MELVNANNKVKLLIKEKSTKKDFEDVLNWLMLRIEAKSIQEINDFDSYYYIFLFKDHKLIFAYNTFLQVSISFYDINVSIEIQNKILQELSSILSENPAT